MTLLYKLLGAVALIAALFFAVNWYNGHQQGIGYQKRVAENNVEFIAKQEQSIQETARMLKGKEDAVNERIASEKKAKILVASAHAESNGLRDTITDLRSKLSSATVEACRATADALADVFGQCADRLVDVATKADGHAADSLMYQQAWPK